MYYGTKVPYSINNRFIKLKGLNINFTTQEVSEGLAKIRQNIISLLETPRGSRFMEPQIGSRLDEFLFEPNDFILRDSLERAVTTAITDFIEGVQVDHVEIAQDVDGLAVRIRVKYLVLSLGQQDEIILYKEKPLTE